MPLSPNDTLLGVRTLHPRYYGIPIEPLGIYSFTFQIKLDLQPVTVMRTILWFSEAGDNHDLLDATNGGPAAVSNTNWNTLSVQGTAPAAAFYAVPGIHFKNRPAGSDPLVSPNIYICAAQFALIGTAATVAAQSPDRFLTLTGPGEPPTQPNAEQIGDTTDTFEGYFIGDPTP